MSLPEGPQDEAAAWRGRDIFISYASEDEPAADVLCATLEASGLSCWMAPRDIIPGQDWASVILDAIESTRAMVLVLSSASNASPQVKREVERAANANKQIIPFRIEEVDPARTLEFFISTPHWSDAFTPPLEAHAKALADNMRRLLAETTDRPPPAPAPRAAAHASSRSRIAPWAALALALAAVTILGLLALSSGLLDREDSRPIAPPPAVIDAGSSPASNSEAGHPFVRTPPGDRGDLSDDEPIAADPSPGE